MRLRIGGQIGDKKKSENQQADGEPRHPTEKEEEWTIQFSGFRMPYGFTVREVVWISVASGPLPSGTKTPVQQEDEVRKASTQQACKIKDLSYKYIVICERDKILVFLMRECLSE